METEEKSLIINPVRNSSGALNPAGIILKSDPAAERQGIISNGVNNKTYIRVWVGLVILTGITVSVAGMNLGRWSVSVVLLIAALKSGLVLSYFMHLKYEKRIGLFKWMIPGVLAVLVLFIGLTFFDVAFR